MTVMESYLPEDENLVREQLIQFEVELEKIPDHEKANLLEAQDRCPEFLTTDFKLLFLRTEILNAKLAARRYCVYWDHRVTLFGQEKAFLPLTLDGAFRDDIDTIERGFMRAVPGHGRLLLIDPSRKRKHYDIDSIARSIWYVATKAFTADVNMQRFGAVFILDMANFGSFDRKLVKRITETTNCGFPLRCDVCCIINPPMMADALVKICKLFLRVKVRSKIHVLKSASKFNQHVGITSEDFDTAIDHEKWMSHMKMKCEEVGMNKKVTS